MQAPESSNAASGSNAAGGSAGQAEEVERRNAPGGSNTTPELANDATGVPLDLLHQTQPGWNNNYSKTTILCN